MIELDLRQVERIERIFKNTPQQVPIVISRAINRASQAGRTQAAREARSLYTVKHGDVLKTLKINKASSNAMRASISSRGELIPLTSFNARATQSGVSVAVKKGERKQLKSVFIRTLKNPRYGKGAHNVFGRLTKSRIPLRGHYGPSIPQMIGNEDATDSVKTRISEVLDDRIRHEIEFLLRGE